MAIDRNIARKYNPQETLRAACASFTDRLKAVVKNKGGYFEKNYVKFESFYLILSKTKYQYCFRMVLFCV